MIAYHRSTDPKDYNESEGFHQMALQDCAMLPSMALDFIYEIKLESLKRNNQQGSFSWGRHTRQLTLQEAAFQLIHDRGLLCTKRGSMTLPDTSQFDALATPSIQQPRRSMIYGKPVTLNELDGVRNGHTALMRAVFHGGPFDVELLLSVGRSVDAQDEAGRTALLCSIILVRHQKNWRMHHTNSCSILRQLVLQPRCDYTQGEHKQQIAIARKLIQ
jgi:hypothetical protein